MQYSKNRIGATALSLAAALTLSVSGASADAASLTTNERQIQRCVNVERQRHGLSRLPMSSGLHKAARQHAQNMVRFDFFAHVDPWGDDPTDRVARFSNHRWAVGENIAGGYDNGRAACRGWIASPGHRANILDPDYEAIGVGFAGGGSWGTVFVQDFGIRVDR